MQTILGAGGAIGRELAAKLLKYTNNVRLVSRNPVAVNPGDDLFAVDLTHPEEVRKAVKGSDVAYLTAGLEYNVKVWKEKWPLIMKNVLEACKAEGASLVFFDNIYMYDPNSLSDITENNPVNPSSEKGKVRACIAQMVRDAHEKGEVKSLIARSADFYGPGVKNVSVLMETVFKPLSQGKSAQVLGRLDKKHSYTYVPDAAKATALLGNTPSAYGTVWHLPTAKDPYTMGEFIEIIAGKFGVKPKSQTANKFLTRTIGLFNPIMKELVEMYYQYDRDYVFNSSKFEKAFELLPVSYDEGIDQIIKADFEKG